MLKPILCDIAARCCIFAKGIKGAADYLELPTSAFCAVRAGRCAATVPKAATAAAPTTAPVL